MEVSAAGVSSHELASPPYHGDPLHPLIIPSVPTPEDPGCCSASEWSLNIYAPPHQHELMISGLSAAELQAQHR